MRRMAPKESSGDNLGPGSEALCGHRVPLGGTSNLCHGGQASAATAIPLERSTVPRDHSGSQCPDTGVPLMPTWLSSLLAPPRSAASDPLVPTVPRSRELCKGQEAGRQAGGEGRFLSPRLPGAFAPQPGSLGLCAASTLLRSGCRLSELVWP